MWQLCLAKRCINRCLQQRLDAKGYRIGCITSARGGGNRVFIAACYTVLFSIEHIWQLCLAKRCINRCLQQRLDAKGYRIGCITSARGGGNRVFIAACYTVLFSIEHIWQLCLAKRCINRCLQQRLDAKGYRIGCITSARGGGNRVFIAACYTVLFSIEHIWQLCLAKRCINRCLQQRLDAKGYRIGCITSARGGGNRVFIAACYTVLFSIEHIWQLCLAKRCINRCLQQRLDAKGYRIGCITSARGGGNRVFIAACYTVLFSIEHIWQLCLAKRCLIRCLQQRLDAKGYRIGCIT